MVSPLILYGACALGALGVLVALPRPRFSPFVVGAILGAAALGVLFVGLAAGLGPVSNAHFYIFSALALGAALRVITHPRPIYSALYFILTILASSGLYLILSAEFMAFALVIVYAGAILITYLFVIMLATEGPTEDAVEAMAEYDRVAREPVFATLAGFVLLAALSTMLMAGASRLTPNKGWAPGDSKLAELGPVVERALRQARGADGKPLMGQNEKIARVATASGTAYAIDPGAGTITIDSTGGRQRVIERPDWPKDLSVSNTQGVGFALIEDHPLGIELAGVILLMAMLGAVVLARKKVEMDERAKADAVVRVRSQEVLHGAFAQPGVGGDR